MNTNCESMTLVLFNAEPLYQTP